MRLLAVLSCHSVSITLASRSVLRSATSGTSSPGAPLLARNQHSSSPSHTASSSSGLKGKAPSISKALMHRVYSVSPIDIEGISGHGDPVTKVVLQDD